MSSVQFDRIALIGIGLIGSSIAYDIRRLGLAKEIVVSTRKPETLKRAEELGLGDRYTISAAEAVVDADLWQLRKAEMEVTKAQKQYFKEPGTQHSTPFFSRYCYTWRSAPRIWPR